MKSYWTNKECADIIKKYKDKTNYFSGDIRFDEMWEMFRHRYRFGEAETAIILASLMKNGAIFQ